MNKIKHYIKRFKNKFRKWEGFLMLHSEGAFLMACAIIGIMVVLVWAGVRHAEY